MQNVDCNALAVAGVAQPQGLTVGLAHSSAELRAAQRLRYEIFAEEMGAQLDCPEAGLDADRFDPHCRHLLVRDPARNRIAAYTRILTDVDAPHAGGFYSQTEFDLSKVLALPGRLMEIGRTCVHPDYRSGVAISLLWQGLARYILLNRIDYLIGCASIPLHDGGAAAAAIMARLRNGWLTPEYLRVRPLIPLPRRDHAVTEEVPMPPLLKGYLRVGARIGGEPCWDADFNCADVFVLVDTASVTRRYRKHFLRAV